MVLLAEKTLPLVARAPMPANSQKPPKDSAGSKRLCLMILGGLYMLAVTALNSFTDSSFLDLFARMVLRSVILRSQALWWSCIANNFHRSRTYPTSLCPILYAQRGVLCLIRTHVLIMPMNVDMIPYAPNHSELYKAFQRIFIASDSLPLHNISPHYIALL